METVNVLLLVNLIVVLVLIGVLLYLASRRKNSSAIAEGNGSKPPTTTQGTTAPDALEVEIHTPAPPLEPTLDLSTPDKPQYRRKDHILSYQERRFYDVLKEGLNSELSIFAKVRMSDVVYLANEPKEKWRHLNLILTRHIDFVVCDMRHRTALLGIELDDSSHNKFDRTESDMFKNTVFQQSGFPFLRFKVETFSATEIETKIRDALNDDTVYKAPEASTRHG